MTKEIHSGSQQTVVPKYDLVEYHQKKLDLYADHKDILERVLALAKSMGLGQRNLENITLEKLES